MYGNGVLTGMMRTITGSLPKKIHRARRKVRIVYFVDAAGSTIPSTAECLAAAIAIQTTDTTS